MKLISKSILWYLLISLPLISLSLFAAYDFIKTELEDATEEAILKEAGYAEKILQRQAVDSIYYLTTDSLSTIVPGYLSIDGIFTDKMVYDTYEEEMLNYRFYKKSAYDRARHPYIITVAKPTMENDDLMEAMLSAAAILLGFLLLVFFLMNWLLSKKLWKPFYQTLETLKSFSLKQDQETTFASPSTKEFREMNTVLGGMTKKIREDFIHQKEFTENAAHEMQTPLAIIKANINLLMQSPQLGPEEMSQLEVLDRTTRKLAALNKGLILLTKIENRQFKEQSAISLGEVVEKTIEHYRDIIDAKEIDLQTTLQHAVHFTMNTSLAEILITNLLQNAIRHNHKHGKILIETQAGKLIIKNTGDPLKISRDDLFVRFRKNDDSAESLGLGLSIVKSICDHYGCPITYHYEQNMHAFIITFAKDLL